MDLLNEVKSLIGGKGIETIAGLLGENTHNTQMAANSGVATLLATLMQSASSGNGSGAAGLLKMLTSGGHDASALTNIAGLLTGGDKSGLSSLMQNGGGLVSSLLGNQSSGILDLLGSVTGVKSSSAGSILSMAAPILMGLLGKNATSGGAAGLLKMLMGQQDAVKSALPSGISSLLGFDKFDAKSVLSNFANVSAPNVTNEVRQAANTVTNTASRATTEVTEAAAGGGNWLPWVLGALGILAALWYFKGCGDKSADAEALKKAAADKQKMITDSLSKYAEKMKADATAALSNFVLPGGTKIEFPKGSVEDKLIGFVTDKNAAIDKTKWFNFEGLNFDTGKATLKAGSEAKLDNVKAIMAAFPAVSIKIGGYTDNVGNAASNKTLSDARAKTVMAELVKRGVAASRMGAEGFGPEFPCADNATEEGRAKNRRIDISVRTK